MHRRTSIYLDDNAMKALKLLAVASGTTVSEKIREAVDVMLAAQVGKVDWPAEIEAMLERARARKLPELSGKEIMAEVQAVRRTRRDATEKKRHARA
ncbi:MAG: ribbon-helix-helix protein, CopG family [Candidatus Eremiobacteraeota bacterium]|nr:ribbon-helix-helix protein, CopG family [Candidatus Eremiobacteraeota bacterium]